MNAKIKVENQNLLTLSVKIPSLLNDKINERVILDKYGMKGKSKWIKEAIEKFLALEDYGDLVNLSEEIGEQNKTITVRIPRKLMLDIEKGIIETRKLYPALEGGKSKIARASMYQRLIRDYGN